MDNQSDIVDQSSTHSNESSLGRSCYALMQCCAKCDREKYPPLLPHSSWHQRFKYAICLCPPHGAVGDILNFVLLAGFLWGSTWAIVGNDALPGTSIFGIVVLFVSAIFGGYIVGLLKPLPPLLGMLVVGFCLRNIPGINIADDIDDKWTRVLRTIALVVVLIRAGLGLEWHSLKKMSGGVLRLSLIPCAVEIVTVTVTSKVFFTAFIIDFPWSWALMLGFVYASVSSAVVVPSMLTLQRHGLGIDRGIPTLLIAAGTMDDVIAIGGFCLVLGTTFSHGSLAWAIMRTPVEIVLGICYGLFTGLICTFIPPVMHKRLHSYRFLMLLLCGLIGEFGAKMCKVEGAGALGVLVLACVTGHGWRARHDKDEEEDPVPAYFGNLWLLVQPILFGLIGAVIDLDHLDGKIIGWGTLVLIFAMAARMLATFLSMMGLGLNLKERLFITLAFIPKATVQAAIGSLALDMAISTNASADDMERGNIIVALSVYIIIMTAPVGAVLIAVTAKHLLAHTPHLLTAEVEPYETRNDVNLECCEMNGN